MQKALVFLQNSAWRRRNSSSAIQTAPKPFNYDLGSVVCSYGLEITFLSGLLPLRSMWAGSELAEWLGSIHKLRAVEDKNQIDRSIMRSIFIGITVNKSLLDVVDSYYSSMVYI